jgi:hypothetical protein
MLESVASTRVSRANAADLKAIITKFRLYAAGSAASGPVSGDVSGDGIGSIAAVDETLRRINTPSEARSMRSNAHGGR